FDDDTICSRGDGEDGEMGDLACGMGGGDAAGSIPLARLAGLADVLIESLQECISLCEGGLERRQVIGDVEGGVGGDVEGGEGEDDAGAGDEASAGVDTRQSWVILVVPPAHLVDHQV